MSNGDTQEVVSAMDVAAFLLRRRFVIAAAVLVVTALVIIQGLLSEREWTSEASFTPQVGAQGGGSSLRQLAGQFGFDIDPGLADQSPQFYARLLQTEEILGKVAVDTFVVESQPGGDSEIAQRGTIAELRALDEEDRAIRIQSTVDWLTEAMHVSTARETGIVSVTVTTPWPELSTGVVSRLLQLTNDFNLRTRQTQAAAERRFIEERLTDAKGELDDAEARLQLFLQNNRRFTNSPELLFEHDRLQRQLSMRQQLYTSLLESYERARIGEVRNTPVITVVQPPTRPAKPDSRHMALRLLAGLALGLVAGISVGLIRDYWLGQKALSTEEYQEVAALWRDSTRGLKKVIPKGR